MHLTTIKRKIRFQLRTFNKYTSRLLSKSYYKAFFALFLLSLFNFYSVAGTKAATNQLLIFCAGSVIAIGLSHLNYEWIKSLTPPFYIFSCILLGMVAVFGTHINGAQRWLKFHSFTFQPTEFVKLAIILMIGGFLQIRNKADTKKDRQYNLLDLLIPLTLTCFPIMLILKQPDLGSAIVCLLITASILFFMGIEKRTLFIILCSALTIGFVGWKHLKPYQRERIEHFINPDIDYRGKSWQSHQSLIAFGSGGLIGSGFKKGPINQLGYLPEKNTDFALASIAEEHGFIFVALILGIVNFIIFKLLMIAQNARDRFSAVLAIGVAFWIGLQALINSLMVIGLAPIVGIPFPVISYGGSSLLAMLIAIGLIANIENKRLAYAG